MRRNAQANRERILEAAEEVFGERGGTGSTEEVARLAGVGVATVFRHFPTKEALIEATLLRHFAELQRQADTLMREADRGVALEELVVTMIETGATKLTLASLVGGEFPLSVLAADADLRATVGEILERADVREDVTIDEVYLLVRGLAQATATMPPDPATLQRAIDIVLRGITRDGSRS